MIVDEAVYLEHHGVKGQKWGIRNQKKSADFKKTEKYRNRKPKELSNLQLKNTNTRINLEQNYRKLNPSAIKKGEMAAKTLLGVAGTAASLYALFNSPIGKAFVNFGSHKAADIMKKIPRNTPYKQLTLF